jgi:hypothetical protein
VTAPRGRPRAPRRVCVVKRLYQRRLADILDALPRRRLPVRSAAGLAVELARSVAGLHKRGVVDQDLRPSNVLLDGRDRQTAPPGCAPSHTYSHIRVTDSHIRVISESSESYPSQIQSYPNHILSYTSHMQS